MSRLALGLLLLAGCDGTVCGDGTIESGGMCVPISPPLCGNGTNLDSGECKPDPSWTGPTCGPFTTLAGDVGEQQCVVDGTMLPPSAGKVNAVQLASPYRQDGVSIGQLGDSPLSMAYDADRSVIAIGFLDDGTGEGTGFVWGGVGQKDVATNLYFLEGDAAFVEKVTWADVDGTMQLQTQPFTLFVRISSEPNKLRLDQARIVSVTRDETNPEVVTDFGFEGNVSEASAMLINLQETGGKLSDLLMGTYTGTHGTVPDTEWLFSGRFLTVPKVVAYP